MLVWALASFGLAPQARAQASFMHSAGGVYLLGIGSGTVLAMPALTYNPRIHFSIADELGLAVSASPAVGFYGSFNSRTGGEGGFGLDLPLNLQLHYGLGSSKESDKGFGMYLGAGFDFATIGSASYWGTTSGRFLGPGFELGVNFYARNNPIGIRTKFLYDVANENLGVFGLGIMYHFGVR